MVKATIIPTSFSSQELYIIQCCLKYGVFAIYNNKIIISFCNFGPYMKELCLVFEYSYVKLKRIIYAKVKQVLFNFLLVHMEHLKWCWHWSFKVHETWLQRRTGQWRHYWPFLQISVSWLLCLYCYNLALKHPDDPDNSVVDANI